MAVIICGFSFSRGLLGDDCTISWSGMGPAAFADVADLFLRCILFVRWGSTFLSVRPLWSINIFHGECQ